MRRSLAGSRTAAAGLVVANLLPLAGVLWMGWTLHSLLVVYWLESAVVGVASILKIRRAEGEDDPEDLPNMSFNDRSVKSFVGRSNDGVASFFVSHYGVFWLVHGIFVMVLPGAFGLAFASLEAVGFAFVGLAAYHAVSYRLNFVEGGEFERTGPVTLMVEPYRRVLVLHLTVVLGFTAIAAIGAPVGALAVMVLVKTVLDFRGHWREHDRASARPGSATAGD